MEWWNDGWWIGGLMDEGLQVGFVTWVALLHELHGDGADLEFESSECTQGTRNLTKGNEGGRGRHEFHELQIRDF